MQNSSTTAYDAGKKAEKGKKGRKRQKKAGRKNGSKIYTGTAAGNRFA